mmetsp:Transcript_14607/g.35260  ORF Transcript_14607/g.35260 Transcript_14607/m.35260 type:complete len:161 (-) Transcript_14607:154-636(-)|eukprot:CAMPEP_0113627994 /NCGR_PEP_ID=MMETSP0017_2-20120614/14501_1 /TAXON_ID=2856 /ORGANISM="Cylindrotheca closterium" /LENGTH=160 /DNA_ID=CAMNT_0000538275 /DNA_START=75 /DNA_END=557 /DNA_ORIENTATION=- /assembly_acc=CAM_ASM_000147
MAEEEGKVTFPMARGADEKPSHEELEDGTRLMLDFTKLQKVAATESQVVPVVAQDVDSGEVYVVAYANELAVRTTLETKKASFWSTSRNELWIKGKTSGNYMDLVEIRINCEQNSLLYLVRGPKDNGTCHTTQSSSKNRSGCYYRKITDSGELEFLSGKK